MNNIKTVGVIFGGSSGEHEVSIKSAMSILENIDYTKFSALPIYIDKNNTWFVQEKLNKSEITESNIIRTNNAFNPLEIQSLVDVVFPVTHGPYGEDGHFQAILELSKVPYVGCNLLSSAIGMDKAVMKDLFKANDIPQGKYKYIYIHSYKQNKDLILNKIEDEFGYPCFIKPANLGSSVGISKAENKDALLKGLQLAFEHDSKVIVEEFLEARELEIGVLGNTSYILSDIGEVETTAKFYDYDAKYNATSQNSITIPASIPTKIKKEIEDVASRVAQLIDVKGLSRIDVFYEGKTGRILVNEINTLPGFTEHSMYPSLFNSKGINFTALITMLIELAEMNHLRKLPMKKVDA